MKHSTTIREDVELIERTIEGLKDWKAIFRPENERQRLLDETERAEVRGRISLLEEGMGLRKAAEWLRNMAAAHDALLGYAVARENQNLPDAVLARAFVNAWVAFNAWIALPKEECR